MSGYPHSASLSGGVNYAQQQGVPEAQLPYLPDGQIPGGQTDPPPISPEGLPHPVSMVPGYPNFPVGNFPGQPILPSTLPVVFSTGYVPGMQPLSPQYIVSPGLVPQNLYAGAGSQYPLMASQQNLITSPLTSPVFPSQTAFLPNSTSNLGTSQQTLVTSPLTSPVFPSQTVFLPNSTSNPSNISLAQEGTAFTQTSGVMPQTVVSIHQQSTARRPQNLTTSGHVPTSPRSELAPMADNSAPPHTYQADPLPTNRKVLPYSMPTKLNPSLQINTSDSQQGYLTSSPLGLGSSSPMSPPGGPPMRTVGWEHARADSLDDQATSGRGSSVSSSLSPPGSSPTSPYMGRGDLAWSYLIPCYAGPANPELCLRCHKKVYPMEKVGPIKGVLYHKNCFNCVVCGTKLNLKTFQHNPINMDDLHVFCASHKPKDKSTHWDASAVHIKSALNVPKLERVNEQIRGDRQHSEVLARIAASGAPQPYDIHQYYNMPHASQVNSKSLGTNAPQIIAQLSPNATHPITNQVEVQTTYNAQEADTITEKSSAPSPSDSGIFKDIPEDSAGINTTHDEEEDSKNHVTDMSGKSSTADEVFRRQDSLLSDMSKPSPTSSISSCSSLSRPDRPSVESVTDLSPGNVSGSFRNVSNSSSSNCGSPILMRLKSDTSIGEDVFSPRSSTSSSTSLRLSGTGMPTSEATKVAVTSRSDRPSASSQGETANPGLPVGVQRTSAARMMVKSQSSHELHAQKARMDASRVLPRNEVRRMDRPSQNS